MTSRWRCPSRTPRRAVAACEEAAVQLGITFQTRFHDHFGRFREVIQDGSLGEIRVVQVEMSPGRTLLKGWRTDPALAGLGAINNLGVHAFDLIGWLLGAEPTEVTALAGHEGGFDPETLALVLLRYGTGALAYVNVNQSVAFPQADITVYGTKGRVVGRSCTRMNMEGTPGHRDRAGRDHHRDRQLSRLPRRGHGLRGRRRRRS